MKKSIAVLDFNTFIETSDSFILCDLNLQGMHFDYNCPNLFYL